jgi:hypothetical protein
VDGEAERDVAELCDDQRSRGRMGGEMGMNMSNSFLLEPLGQIDRLGEQGQCAQKEVDAGGRTKDETTEELQVAPRPSTQGLEIGGQNGPGKVRREQGPIDPLDGFLVQDLRVLA